MASHRSVRIYGWFHSSSVHPSASPTPPGRSSPPHVARVARVKGIVGVIGGHNKSTVWMKVRSEEVVVKDANDFFNTARHSIYHVIFFSFKNEKWPVREQQPLRTRDWSHTCLLRGFQGTI